MSLNFASFFDASTIIKLHIIAAFFALFIGAGQMVMRKGTRPHRLVGKMWVFAMVVVALSSFFIHEIRVIGNFSPIHLLSIITLIWLVFGVQAARKKQIKRHQIIMNSIYFFALIVTGFFTLLPGRLMHEILFG
jgi:uncharacterized membrane protein